MFNKLWNGNYCFRYNMPLPPQKKKKTWMWIAAASYDYFLKKGKRFVALTSWCVFILIPVFLLLWIFILFCF